MEPFQWAMIIVAALSALLTAGGVIAAVTWKISGIEKTLKDAIIEERKSIDGEHVAIRREFSDELDVVRREIGEVGTALRTKIHDVETWSRDNFARRGSLGEMRLDMNEQFKAMRAAMEKRFDKMEDKIDHRSGQPSV